MIPMKRLFLAALLVLAAPILRAQELRSPDGTLTLHFTLDEGVPRYALDCKGRAAVAPSRLGLLLRGEGAVPEFNAALSDDEAPCGLESLRDGFELVKAETSAFDETWQPVWGEESDIRNRYNELAVTLRRPADDRTMIVRFRLYDDGLGFRYEFPEQPKLVYFVVADECTEFAMTGDHTAW